MPTSYTPTPDGEIPVYLSVDWTAPEFKDLGLTMAAGFMAWVRAKLDELKFKRESWSVQREPGDRIGIEADAFEALQAIPEIRAYTTRTAAEFHERHVKTTIAPLTQFNVVLPELGASIADLADGQELDPDLAGNTVLRTHIATLSEAHQELRAGVQQLKHITLPGSARWAGAERHGTIPLYTSAYIRLMDCIWGIEAALERDLMQAYKDGTWQEKREAREACRIAFQKLQDARRELPARVKTLKTKPAELP